MINEWSLRNEILSASHRWPVIVLYCLIGCLLGYAAGLAWPSPDRASLDLYVGLNVHRAFEDGYIPAQFNYPDDYKNWQMENLKTLVFTQEVTRETLDKLRASDEFWIGVSREDLVKRMDVYWRNAGEWNLVVEGFDREHNAQAVQVWSEVILERVHVAVFHARELLPADAQIKSLAAEETNLTTRLAELELLFGEIQRWQQAAQSLPADQTAGAAMHWELITPVQIAAAGEAWERLLAGAPAMNAPLSEHTAWAGRAAIFVNDAMAIVQARLGSIPGEQAQAVEAYSRAADRSLGFSASLEVERVSDSGPEHETIRPAGLLALLGGVLGLLAWAVFTLGRSGMRAAA